MSYLPLTPDPKWSASEHLAWAKARALFWLDQGKPGRAMAEFVGDLGKRDEWVRSRGDGDLWFHERLEAGLRAQGERVRAGTPLTVEEGRRFVEGFTDRPPPARISQVSQTKTAPPVRSR